MATTKRKTTNRKTKQAPTPTRTKPTPLDPAKVQLAAMRELMRILTERPAGVFKLPSSYRRVFTGAPEYGFAKVLMRGDCGFEGLCALAEEEPAAIYAHLVRLAAGATSPAFADPYFGKDV